MNTYKLICKCNHAYPSHLDGEGCLVCDCKLNRIDILLHYLDDIGRNTSTKYGCEYLKSSEAPPTSESRP